MEKSGKFQASDNKLTVLGEIPQLPWKLPQISLWKVHKLPEVNTMERQVKYWIGSVKLLGLPQVKYGKYHGKPLVAAPEVKILFPGKTWDYLRWSLGNSTMSLWELPQSSPGNMVMACGKSQVIYGKVRT